MQELDDPKGPTTPQDGVPQDDSQGRSPVPQPGAPQPGAPQPEAPLPFASPMASTSSLSFREDSANLPAPAPFQVIGQPTAPKAPEPFSSQVTSEQMPSELAFPNQVASEQVASEPASAVLEAPVHTVPPLSSNPPPSLLEVSTPATPSMVETPAPLPPITAEAPIVTSPAAGTPAAGTPAAGTPAAERLPQVETQPLSTIRPAVSDQPPAPAPAMAAETVVAPTVVAPEIAPLSEVATQMPNTPPPYQGPDAGARRLQQAVDVMSRLRQRMRAQILGRDEVIDLVLVALLADGHVLLEDFPGSGKTTLAKSLGSSIVNPVASPQQADDEDKAEEDDSGIADFRRIQFTPDLLPSDVTGVSVFDVNTHRFDFRRGPIFAHVVLADEINRTSPKVQSAMLEAMAEKQVTVDNVTYPLDPLFFVIATQNPLDLAGTYPLPVAQLDRFLFKIRMQHIDRQAELEVLNTYRQRRDMERQDLPKVTRLDLLAARRAIDDLVAIEPPIKECLVDIAHRLRGDERVLQGNSTRSLVLILPALQALATLRGRDFVSGDDLQTLIPRVFGHRVELAPGVTDMEQVLTEVMEGPIEALSRSTLRRRR